jgi:hypothetical protein
MLVLLCRHVGIAVLACISKGFLRETPAHTEAVIELLKTCAWADSQQ